MVWCQSRRAIRCNELCVQIATGGPPPTAQRTFTGGTSLWLLLRSRMDVRMRRMPATLRSMASSPSTGRSLLRPLGSPTLPVAPPTSAIGVWPHLFVCCWGEGGRGRWGGWCLWGCVLQNVICPPPAFHCNIPLQHRWPGRPPLGLQHRSNTSSAASSSSSGSGSGDHVSAPLEPRQHDDAQQVAQVQAVGGGVKPAVDRQAGAGRQRLKLLRRHLLDQPALAQDRDDAGRGEARRRCCAGGGCGVRGWVGRGRYVSCLQRAASMMLNAM